ncbi:MAG: YlbF family regulator [Verrucomicrobiota bacterium]|nr:YlbF family regulator [Limisphaera sp.]MDW8381994.1 YlbF family regulator [Verrucomicrobiota bacterium]
MSQNDAIGQKTRELCATILEDAGFQSAQRSIQAFLDDEKARAQYEEVVSLGQALRRKQQYGEPLSEEEVQQFERARESLLANEVARRFLDAQAALEEMRQAIQQQVSLTMELGRMPTEEDIHGCGCGSGCGCH